MYRHNRNVTCDKDDCVYKVCLCGGYCYDQSLDEFYCDNDKEHCPCTLCTHNYDNSEDDPESCLFHDNYESSEINTTVKCDVSIECEHANEIVDYNHDNDTFEVNKDSKCLHCRGNKLAEYKDNYYYKWNGYKYQ